MRDENMSYTVKSSERLRKSGSEAETKALLYLMNFRPDSDDIYYFVVDFFNDLTGMDNMASRLWDVQSKGAHHVSPKAIGKELVTLFKNYMSPLTFEAYVKQKLIKVHEWMENGMFRIKPVYSFHLLMSMGTICFFSTMHFS